MVASLERNKFYDFDKVFQFGKHIQLYNEGTWRDSYGITVINMGRDIIAQFFQELRRQHKVCSILLSPLAKEKIIVPLNYRLDDQHSANLDCIVSLGGAREHNVAKELLLRIKKAKKLEFVTIPFPLSNDSFCTNRSSPCFDNIEIPSREATYPSKILVDFNLLESINKKYNLVGLGEIVGLYYSVRDYYSVRKLPQPHGLISKIEKSTQNLVASLENEKRSWLRQLAINLLIKCLLMRLAEDNRIGAGGDHLIAYALKLILENQKSFRNFSHGELVYLGCICMAALFPEWEYNFFSLKNLIHFGKNVGLLKIKSLRLLINALRNGLISLALQMRPNRPTILSTLLSKQIRNGCMKLGESLGGIR